MLTINKYNLLNDSIYSRVKKINEATKNGTHTYLKSSTLLKELEKRVNEINEVCTEYLDFMYVELKKWDTRKDHKIIICEHIPF